MARIGMHEAKTKLSQLVERAESGEEIVIQRNGKPVARLVPIADEFRSLGAIHGAWEGKVTVGADFDQLPADIADSFGAG